MRKVLLPFTLLCALFFLNSFVEAAYTPALALLTNIAKITAANSPTAPTSATNVTTGTMFGGTAVLDTSSSVPIQTIGNFQRTLWTINVTNYGNANANFQAAVVASNVRRGAGTWNWHFNNQATLNGLAPFAMTSIQFVISNIAPATNGSYMSYLVRLSNMSAQIPSRVYKGSTGTNWYGGRLGVWTNYNKTNYVSSGGAFHIGPVFFLPFAKTKNGDTNQAGFLTAIIAGPVLQISKKVTLFTRPVSGLTYASSGTVEPGTYIQYRIFVTNSGSAAATNVKIVDHFASSFLDFVSTNSNINFRYDAANSTPATGNLIFTNILKRLPDVAHGTAATSRGIISYTVRVK